MNKMRERRTTTLSVHGGAASSYSRSASVVEDAVLDNLGSAAAMTTSSPTEFALEDALPEPQRIHALVSQCPERFARNMAYGLVRAAIVSHDTADWEVLGDYVVNWVNGLEMIVANPNHGRRRTKLDRSNSPVRAESIPLTAAAWDNDDDDIHGSNRPR